MAAQQRLIKDLTTLPSNSLFMFKSTDWKNLAEKLPSLHFDIEKDLKNTQSPAVQQYLDYYKINFTKTLPGIKHGFGCFDADEFKIAAHYWLPEIPRGTIFVVHGYLDHVGIFSNLIRFSLQNEYAVIAFDLPGMGLSSGDRAAIKSFSQYYTCFDTLLQKSQRLMPKPWFCVAQSTGATVALQYLFLTEKSQFEKVVLLSPLVRSMGWGRDKWVYAFARYFIRSIPRVVNQNSHDDEFIKFMKSGDPMQSKRIPLSWIGAMKEWIDTVKSQTPKNDEILIIQGNGDQTVDWQYNLSELKRVLPKLKLKMVPDGRHHLVAESAPYRAQVFAALKSFIEKKSAVMVEETSDD